MKEYAAPKFIAYLDAIARVIAEGQERGELRDDVSPHLAARAVFGALDGIAMTWALGKAEHGGLSRASGQLGRDDPAGLTPRALSDRRRDVAREHAAAEAAARARPRLARRCAAFFDARGFLEVQTPLVVPSPGLDVHLDAFEVAGGTAARRAGSSRRPSTR